MINLTLKQMRYVEAAGRLGSIANASQELSISQSSISAAIDSLEEYLRYDLFVRTPAKGIRPTPPGQIALQTIRQFLDQFKHFEAELLSIGGEASGTIRIACFVTAVGSFMPPILRQFQGDNPHVEIQLLEATMEGVVDLLNDGHADMAFTYSDVAGSAHAFEPLIAVPPYALVPRDGSLGQQENVSLAELAEYPMILFDLPRTGGYYLNFLTNAGHKINVIHKTRSVEMVRTLVGNGFGFSILNARPSEYVEGRSMYRVMPIREALEHRIFGILRQADTREPVIVRRFAELCHQLRDKGSFETMVVESHSTKKMRNKAH